MDDLCALLRAKPDDIATRETLAKLYMAHGMAKHAFDQFAHLHALMPTKGMYCLQLGFAMHCLGQTTRAIRWYRHAIDLSPLDAIPHNNLANCLVRQKHFRSAEHHYKRAIAMDPQFADAFSNYGSLLHETARPKQAIDAYWKALHVDPCHVTA